GRKDSLDSRLRQVLSDPRRRYPRTLQLLRGLCHRRPARFQQTRGFPRHNRRRRLPRSRAEPRGLYTLTAERLYLSRLSRQNLAQAFALARAGQWLERSSCPARRAALLRGSLSPRTLPEPKRNVFSVPRLALRVPTVR